jgi:hypothetical protein
MGPQIHAQSRKFRRVLLKPQAAFKLIAIPEVRQTTGACIAYVLNDLIEVWKRGSYIRNALAASQMPFPLHVYLQCTYGLLAGCHHAGHRTLP